METVKMGKASIVAIGQPLIVRVMYWGGTQEDRRKWPPGDLINPLRARVRMRDRLQSFNRLRHSRTDSGDNLLPVMEMVREHYAQNIFQGKVSPQPGAKLFVRYFQRSESPFATAKSDGIVSPEGGADLLKRNIVVYVHFHSSYRSVRKQAGPFSACRHGSTTCQPKPGIVNSSVSSPSSACTESSPVFSSRHKVT